MFRYGTIETPETYYLTWKEEDPAWTPGNPPEGKYLSSTTCEGGQGALDCALLRMLSKARFLELVHDFIVFDAGTKKVCRPNQFFGELPLIEAIVERGLDAATGQLPEGLREDKASMAETIENNVRRTIVDRQDANPKYYEKMSRLLDVLIQQRKAEAMSYKAYLERLEEIAHGVLRPEEATSYPPGIDTSARRALYDNLDEKENLALRLCGCFCHRVTSPGA